jgi:hypothetical protein
MISYDMFFVLCSSLSLSFSLMCALSFYRLPTMNEKNLFEHDLRVSCKADVTVVDYTFTGFVCKRIMFVERRNSVQVSFQLLIVLQCFSRAVSIENISLMNNVHVRQVNRVHVNCHDRSIDKRTYYTYIYLLAHLLE